LAAAGAAAHDGIDARLKGVQEVPAISSAAKGRLKAFVDERSGAIHYDLSYSGLENTVTMAHIHLGRRGVGDSCRRGLCQRALDQVPGRGDPRAVARRRLRRCRGAAPRWTSCAAARSVAA